MKTNAAQNELIATIERAWAHAPRPSEGRIAVSPDKYEDRAELEEALRGMHWRDVPLDKVSTLRVELSALTPEGLRFYLPAFLVASVGETDEARDIRFFLLSHFEVSVRQGTLAKELAHFSEPERSALRAFFEHMAHGTKPGEAEDWHAVAVAVPG
jgi:hypothetical protein